MSEILTSANNSTMKRLRKLMTSSKARRDENTFVAEGIHLAKSFLAAKRSPELYVCAESALNNHEIMELVRDFEAVNTPRVILSDSLFESIATIHASSGIIILFTPKESSKDMAPLTDSAVLLEDVQDPGNLGTILRTAAAAGIQHALLSRGCASPWSPKALRAGMGAQFSLIIDEEIDLIEAAKKARVPVLATMLAEDSVSLYEIDLRRPVAWALGSEGQGISKALAQSAAHHVHIPQAHTSVESLNVAAAAAICIYEHYRQNNA